MRYFVLEIVRWSKEEWSAMKKGYYILWEFGKKITCKLWKIVFYVDMTVKTLFANIYA